MWNSEHLARRLGLPREDVARNVAFWKEPDVTVGRETIVFRVGKYIGDYAVHMDNPPELEDGFFLPPDLSDLLAIYASGTDISRLRSP